MRAQHLDLSRSEVPDGTPVEGRRFVLDHLDLPARWAYRGTTPSPRATMPRPTRREAAFWANDDPLPFFAMAARFAGPATGASRRARRARCPRAGANPAGLRRLRRGAQPGASAAHGAPTTGREPFVARSAPATDHDEPFESLADVVPPDEQPGDRERIVARAAHGVLHRARLREAAAASTTARTRREL